VIKTSMTNQKKIRLKR